MRSVSALLALSALLVLVQPSTALYFHVTEGAMRCFIEEVPDGTLVLAQYKSPDVVPSTTAGVPTTGIRAVVTDPSGAKVLERDLSAEGRFAFTSLVGGEHVLCFATNSTRWFGQPKKFRVDLVLNVGEMAIDYTEVAKREHLTALEVEVRKLNDKVRDIMKEQSYQREREEMFRDTTESTNSRVQWWSIAQTIVLVVSGVWQIYHLKNFFIAKKLK